jgi:hypothetical protein
MILKWLETGFRFVIWFIERLQVVITNNYNSIDALHNPKITLTTVYIKTSLAVAR